MLNSVLQSPSLFLSSDIHIHVHTHTFSYPLSLSPLPQPLPTKPEPSTVARVKGSPPMQRANSSNEPSSRKAPKPQQMHKGHSVDDRTMLNSRGTGTYSQQTPVPRAATDFRAHSPSPLVQPALAQSFQFTPADHRGDNFDRPPIPPRSGHAEVPGFRGAPSASHTHSAGFTGGSGGGVPSNRPYIHQGGWEHSSNIAATGPSRSQHNISPIITGGYHDPHNPIPRASTRPDAPLGYYQQLQPAQKRNAFPHHSSLHPGYPNASPSSLPPMPSISSEANAYHKHAHDDSGLYHEHTPDFVEKDSPPSSNISSQSSQSPEASQQLSQYSRGHRQPAGGGSGRQGALPSRFVATNSPRPSQQTYPPQQREASYPTPMSHVPVSHQPTPRTQFGHHGPNTTSNLLDEPQARRTPHAHTANLHYSVQETQQGPSPQVKYPPGMRGAPLNTVATSQPNQGLESNQLEVGIEREIYFTAKDVIKSDSEAPQTLVDEDIPYDPNLICPKCNSNFRIGEIQKYRRHVATCQVSRK